MTISLQTLNDRAEAHEAQMSDQLDALVGRLHDHGHVHRPHGHHPLRQSHAGFLPAVWPAPGQGR